GVMDAIVSATVTFVGVSSSSSHQSVTTPTSGVASKHTCCTHNPVNPLPQIKDHTQPTSPREAVAPATCFSLPLRRLLGCMNALIECLLDAARSTQLMQRLLWHTRLLLQKGGW